MKPRGLQSGIATRLRVRGWFGSINPNQPMMSIPPGILRSWPPLSVTTEFQRWPRKSWSLNVHGSSLFQVFALVTFSPHTPVSKNPCNSTARTRRITPASLPVPAHECTAFRRVPAPPAATGSTPEAERMRWHVLVSRFACSWPASHWADAAKATSRANNHKLKVGHQRVKSPSMGIAALSRGWRSVPKASGLPAVAGWGT
jgi:hypothetical protein